MADQNPPPLSLRHVWVLGHGGYGLPVPGLVVDWQRLGVHHATSSGWAALVATAPFADALVLEWVAAERLDPVRNPDSVDL